jgi:hypothetical protein
MRLGEVDCGPLRTADQKRRGGDSNSRYLAVRWFSRPVHSATLPPLRGSRGPFGADCREFRGYVNHTILLLGDGAVASFQKSDAVPSYCLRAGEMCIIGITGVIERRAGVD